MAGKCAFCDYIEDNSKNTEEIIKLNKEVLSNVKGIYGVLEVIISIIFIIYNIISIQIFFISI